jgi:hypothetical protein
VLQPFDMTPEDLDRITKTIHCAGIRGLRGQPGIQPGEEITEEDLAAFFGNDGEVRSLHLSHHVTARVGGGETNEYEPPTPHPPGFVSNFNFAAKKHGGAHCLTAGGRVFLFCFPSFPSISSTTTRGTQHTRHSTHEGD